MTEAGRTPGPWHIMEGTDWVIISPEVSVAAVYTPRGDREVRQANAHLIAAAPDLLEALEYVLSKNTIDMDDAMIDVVTAALAKAKGEEADA